MGSRRTALAAMLVVAVLPLVATGPAAGRPPADKPLTKQRWTFRVPVDGRGRADKVTITARKGFTVNELNQGTGQLRVRVDLAGSTRFATMVVDVFDYHSQAEPWSPWYGSTQLDHRPGRELILGVSTGVHTISFAALRYQRHELRSLPSPLGTYWSVNASVGTGVSGWRCFPHGVELRAVSPPSGGQATWTRDRYRFKRGWVLTSHRAESVPVDAQGNPPPHLARPIIGCKGLPTSTL